MKSSMIIHPDEVSKKWIHRLADAGVDVLGIHPVGGMDAAASLADLLERIKTKEFRALIDYALSRGLEVEYEIHAAGYLMPRALFAEHPDYFRMNEQGERTKDWNFCVSNPEAMALFSRRAAELALALYGSRPAFYFWMDDGRDLHCHCPKCKHLSPSDQQLMAVRGMLREIRKQIPTARMAYLAYVDSIVPPGAVSPEEGVFLEYAPFAKYTATGEDASERIAKEKEMIRPLMDFFGGEPPKVLEYWYDNSLYSGWKKPPAKFVLDREAMECDIAEYRRMGFEAISTFACFLGEDYEALHGDVDVAPFGACLK
ncbi:MAG: DUF4838 domain-containing protein [Clostridia bacterium]|nr:DUF4838 domain-containing protein [Clostridia bacterium]